MPSNTALKRTTQKAKTGSRVQNIEKQIMGVPSSIMLPRLALIALVAALVCFGFIMIYSASSVKALSSMGDAAYYVRRQMGFAALGLGLAIAIAHFDYHFIAKLLPLWWCLILAALVAVWLLGEDTNGASRWIEIAGIRVQPSEFAKVMLIVAVAQIAFDYYGTQTIDLGQALLRTVFYVGVPLGLIFIQPDKGTTGIIAVMAFAIIIAGGFPPDLAIRFIGLVAVCALVFSLTDDYSRQRILTMIDPSSDPYDTGYQLNQGFIAFGSGGLFGVGLGMSRQKYSYLPEAHNDFIFAIIGEEWGLVGTLLVVAAFFALTYVCIKIAKQAPDMLGRLIVIGTITIILTQFFLNAMGVLGLFPLSGKPMPFLSYGGSAIISQLMMMGLVVSVSRKSTLPETDYDRRRRSMSLADEEDTGVGEAVVRGAAPAGAPLALNTHDSSARSASKRSGLRLVDGGSASSSSSSQGSRGSGAQGRSGSYERVDLGPSASERLRSSSSRGSSSNGSRNSRNKRS